MAKYCIEKALIFEIFKFLSPVIKYHRAFLFGKIFPFQIQSLREKNGKMLKWVLLADKILGYLHSQTTRTVSGRVEKKEFVRIIFVS